MSKVFEAHLDSLKDSLNVGWEDELELILCERENEVECMKAFIAENGIQELYVEFEKGWKK